MHIPVIQQYVDLQKNYKQNLILAPTGNLGIPRTSMPQIDSKHRAEFIKFMQAHNVKVRNIRVPAKSLKMVQGEYNRDKVAAIMDGGKISGPPIFVSKEGYVVDGNHRLIAFLNMENTSRYIEVTELCMEIKPLLDLISQFSEVRFRGLNAG